MRSLLAPALVFQLLTVACGSDSDAPAVGSLSASLTASAPEINACNELGDAKTQTLFRAIASGDAQELGDLFADDGSMEFTLTPDIVAALETSIEAADNDHTGVQTFDHDGITDVLSRLAEFELSFPTEISGGTYVDPDPARAGRLVYGFGPVHWQATGEPLEEHGKAKVVGGGKLAMDCATGRFEKVLLSPLAFE